MWHSVARRSRADHSSPPEPLGTTPGFHQAKKKLTTLPVPRYGSVQRKRSFEDPIGFSPRDSRPISGTSGSIAGKFRRRDQFGSRHRFRAAKKSRAPEN